MAEEVKKDTTHKGLIATLGLAIISAYVSVTIARINAQSEFQKASLGYEKIVQSMNQLQEHAKKEDEFDANLQGQLQALNSILQFAFQAQTGKKYVVTPPAKVPTYGEFSVKPERPPVRRLVQRVDSTTPPKQAAALAVEGLKNIQADADQQPQKEPIKLTPLPSKL